MARVQNLRAHAVFLGVQLRDGPGDQSATIVGVSPGGPAAEAGLATGDVIVALDGEPVTGVDDLHRLLTEERAGCQVILTVLRRAAMKEVTLTAGEG